MLPLFATWFCAFGEARIHSMSHCTLHTNPRLFVDPFRNGKLSSWHPNTSHIYYPRTVWFRNWEFLLEDWVDWDLTGAPCQWMLIDYTNASKCGVQEEHSHWGQMLLAMPQFVSRGTIASIALAMWSFLYWNFTKTLLVSPDHCNLKSHSMTLQCCGPFWKSLHNMFGSCFEITKILISKSDT